MRIGLGKFASGTLTSAVGLGTRAVLQAVYLVAISRWLGAETYGLFAGSVAAAALLAPLAGAGAGFVYMEMVSRQPTLMRPLWPRAFGLALCSCTALALLALLVSVAAGAMNIDLTPLIWLVVAELVALPLAQICATVLMAARRPGIAAVSVCAVPAARVAVVLWLVFSGAFPTLSTIAYAHGVASVAAAIAVIAMVSRVIGRHAAGTDAHDLPMRRRLFAEGLPYAWGAFLGYGYLEVDKVLLLHLAGATAAGTYTVAFRVVSVLIIPVTALLANALPRLIRARAGGESAPRLSSIVGYSIVYSMCAAGVAIGLAPFVTDIFGTGFAASAQVLRGLAAWLVVATLHQCGAAALLGYGGKRARMFVEASGFLAVVGLNWALLPKYGASGAVYALLASELLMAAACWWMYRRCRDPYARQPH